MEILDKILVGVFKTYIAFLVLSVVHTSLAEDVHKDLKNSAGWRKIVVILYWSGALLLITLGAVAFAGDNCLSWSRDGECTWTEDRTTFMVRWFSMLAIATITGVKRLSNKETK